MKSYSVLFYFCCVVVVSAGVTVVVVMVAYVCGVHLLACVCTCIHFRMSVHRVQLHVGSSTLESVKSTPDPFLSSSLPLLLREGLSLKL